MSLTSTSRLANIARKIWWHSKLNKIFRNCSVKFLQTFKPPWTLVYLASLVSSIICREQVMAPCCFYSSCASLTKTKRGMLEISAWTSMKQRMIWLKKRQELVNENEVNCSLVCFVFSQTFPAPLSFFAIQAAEAAVWFYSKQNDIQAELGHASVGSNL